MAFDKALVTKFTTLGVVGITIGLAVWGFFTPLCPDETCIDTVINNVFICFNLSLLSMVLLPSEFQVKWIQDGFGLIDNLFGRGLYIFLYFNLLMLALDHGSLVYIPGILKVEQEHIPQLLQFQIYVLAYFT